MNGFGRYLLLLIKVYDPLDLKQFLDTDQFWTCSSVQLIGVKYYTWKIQDGGFETDFLSVPLNNIIPVNSFRAGQGIR